MMTALIISEIIVINQVAQKIIAYAWLGICHFCGHPFHLKKKLNAYQSVRRMAIGVTFRHLFTSKDSLDIF